MIRSPSCRRSQRRFLRADLERLLAEPKSAEQRGCALALYDAAFARWRAEHSSVEAAFKRLRSVILQHGGFVR